MDTQDGSLKIIGLRDLYHELGEYEFKVVLPRNVACEYAVDVIDSDGTKHKLTSIRRWGHRISCKMGIDMTVPDGVAIVIAHVDIGGEPFDVSKKFWVVK